jgi:hypothetical protein
MGLQHWKQADARQNGKLSQESKMSEEPSKDAADQDREKDQTTRPSVRKPGEPIEHRGPARQPKYDRQTTPDHSSDDPSE